LYNGLPVYIMNG